MSELALSDKVDALESLILQVPQVDLQTKHELDGTTYNPGAGAGVYVRRGGAWHFLG